MTIYAVMKSGGKEYRVAPGDLVRVGKLAAAPGATVEIREVCSIEIGKNVTVGSPIVAGARVVAEVVEEGHGEKIVTFKKKRRNHYQMTMEDLQSFTVLRIREIVYDVAATVTAPPPPAPIEPQPPVAVRNDAPVAAQEAQPSSDAVHLVQLVELPPSAPASTPPIRIELPPPIAVPADAPVAPKMDPVLSREPRKRSHGIAALVAAVVVIAAGLLVWGGGQPRGPVEVATAVAAPQAAQASVPQAPAKAPPRKEAAIRNPAAASAPSAPVQPPE